MITTVAPAKINWTLEVLGKRSDGYHEIRSVMQAIDLHDEVSLDAHEAGGLHVAGTGIPADDDLAAGACREFEKIAEAHGAVTVIKKVPLGAGLGGGSSDGAAVLRLLSGAAGPATDDRLRAIAATLGSDVPFFLRGGTAVTTGRGEDVTPLPDVAGTWLVLVVPPIRIDGKTRRMYSELAESDFSDGSRTRHLADAIEGGRRIGDEDVVNDFERAAYEVFEGLDKFRTRMIEAGARAAHLCGAGPALFALTSGEAEARAIRARMVRPKMGERVHAVRTIGAAESTLTWES